MLIYKLFVMISGSSLHISQNCRPVW